MQLRRISILGVGLLGGSLGLALKSAVSDCHVIGWVHRRATLQAALKIGAIHEGYDQLAPAVHGAELVILCTPVGLFQSLLEDLVPLLPPQALVTDVGSTKRLIVASADHLFPGRFVGGHPMAGSEKRGVEHARADLYRGALCILTPTARTSAAALEQIDQFWRMLGMRTCRMSPEEHDRRLSDVSHLPHAVASSLVAMQEDASLPLSGKGFADLTRIASGDSGLWRDIFLDNRDHLKQSLAKLRRQLDELEGLLEPSQADALQAWLQKNSLKRQRMLDQSKEL